MTEGPILNSTRILDFSWVMAGPYATRILADFGAEVIKVQSLLPEARDKFSAGYYNNWNRNKLSITLNPGKPEGLEIARQLIKISDIVVENFSPRVMSNWGLDYPEVRKIKPEIIYLSMSAMGHSGPWKDYAGFGPTVQAFSGITYLTAYPGLPPVGLGHSFSDHIAGLYASLALLGALENRRNTGKGQYIDLSQTETMTSLLSDTILDYTLKGREAQPTGNGSEKAAPHGIYPCRGTDRWCAIAVFTDTEWEGFKRALGNPEWAQEERFSTLSNRLKNTAALDRYVQGWTREQTAENVMAILQKEQVPSGLVQNAADLAADPQLQFRGFFRKLEYSTTDANPCHLSENPANYRRPAPVPGQDNDYVYRNLLGMSQTEIEKLKQERVI